MPAKPTVSIIIVHFNTQVLTTACVKSIIDKSHGIDYEIIVVDNASTKGDISSLASLPNVKLIRSEKNTGFAGGNNLGIGHASGEYILLLNSDTELANNAIALGIKSFQMAPDCGALSAKLIYPDGSLQYPTGRFPTLYRTIQELLRLPKLKGPKALSDFYLGDRFDHETRKQVDWIWGAYFLTTKQVLAKLSGNPLPADFFMYYEDVQWCYEIHKAGYSVWYDPAPVVIHHLSGSLESKNEEEKYRTLIFPNERKFLVSYKGRLYKTAYYFLKWLLYKSLAGKDNQRKADFIWKEGLQRS